jgi:hypothetical protein
MDISAVICIPLKEFRRLKQVDKECREKLHLKGDRQENEKQANQMQGQGRHATAPESSMSGASISANALNITVEKELPFASKEVVLVQEAPMNTEETSVDFREETFDPIIEIKETIETNKNMPEEIPWYYLGPI